jgi:aspartyl-tRNA(Asn)/glutamyl-tRNA(Gln) amidotransferase subunit C
MELKMSVTIQDVDNMARLSKLSFSDTEKETFVEQFNQILQYMEKLNELDTTDVEPTYNVQDISNVMRDDIVKPSLKQEDAIANAPKSSHGFFSVPKVIG